MLLLCKAAQGRKTLQWHGAALARTGVGLTMAARTDHSTLRRYIARNKVATHLSDRSRDRLLSREGWRLVRLLDSEADSASLRLFAAESTLP